MHQPDYDVIIVGAGPAGSACAIVLGNSGFRVALLDKAVFPRDKICGDALSIDVVNQLAMMDDRLAAEFAALQGKTASYGVKIVAASGDAVDIPLYYKGAKGCGYVMPRYQFDAFLFGYAQQQPYIDCFESCSVEDIRQEADGITVVAAGRQWKARMVVGADGAHSVVAKLLVGPQVDRKYYSGGLRQYYEGVTGFHADNLIELHFLKGTVPGYWWVFPLPDGRANVGIGIPSRLLARKKINLRKTFEAILATQPHLQERFKNARPLETVKGFGLPLGGKKRPLSGNRFLLVGDAASLIDPFSGEGIGNAIRSGRLAAAHIKQAVAANRFDAGFNKAYDGSIYRVMLKEFRISRLLLRLASMPRLCGFIVRRANTVAYIRQQVTGALGDLELRGSLFRKPGFYWRLLFGRSAKGKQETL
jgi:menaquinone-9 beta-reductase